MRFFTTSFFLTALSVQSLLACCGVAPEDQTIQFGRQDNIVIYNSKTQTEYFIRNARFESKAKDIGFIAPTPSQPEITKTDNAIFSFIDSKQPKPRFSDSASGPAATKAAGEVEVIDIVEVAGYKATILKASDANALTSYLKEHSYATTPSLTKWTDFYIKKGWYLTAFQVINKKEMLETGVLCMKFKTDKPFNPYYVPTDNIKDPAGLTLSFISDQNYEPTIGGTDPYDRPKWQSKLTTNDLGKIAGFVGMPLEEIPQSAFLTQYQDSKFPVAQSDDIYFVPRSSAKNFAALFGPEATGGDARVYLSIPIILLGAAQIAIIKKFRKKERNQ
jgi:hypothetical protein